MGALVAIGVLPAAAPSARALTIISNPFGTPATGYINHDPDDGNEWINWQENATGACTYAYLGPGGFYDDFKVVASNAGDIIAVVKPGQSFAFCGYNQQAPNYNGHYCDLAGGTGNDRLSCGTGDSELFGGAGNDVIQNGGGVSMFMSGDDGNDTLVWSANPYGGFVMGGAGNDCLNVSTAGVAPSMTCGSGMDQWSGPGTRPTDCEANLQQCCPGLIC